MSGYCLDWGLIQAAQLEKIKGAIEQLEAENPLQNPTEHLDLLAGRWSVLFTTIKVTVGPSFIRQMANTPIGLCQRCMFVC